MESRFSRIFERFLVFSTIVSLMLTATSVFSPVLNNYEVERVLIDWFTYILIIGSGIVFTLVLQIFALEKIKPAMHLVFIVFYIFGILFLCYITGKTNAPYVLIVILTVQYFLQVGINELFIFHDAFMYDCEDYAGKELEQYLFHNNLSAIDLTEKIKGQQVMMFAISISMFVVLVFGKLSEGYFSFITLLLVIFFYLNVLLCCFMLGMFKNDIFYAFLGFKDYVRNGRKLFASVLLIAAISCTAGAVLSSDNALIKIGYVQEYKETHEKERYIPELPDFIDFQIEPQSEERMERNTRPSWILEFIAELIKWLSITGLSILGLIFFIKPFFTKHFRVFWTEGHLLKFLRELWQEIREFFRYVFSKSTGSDEQYSTVQGKKFRESMMEFLKKSKRSKEKIDEIDRLTKHFMRLIDWGQSHGIKFTQTLAPAEYTALFKNKTADLVGQLFEKALYDKNVLTEEEEKIFIASIKEIICE